MNRAQQTSVMAVITSLAAIVLVGCASGPGGARRALPAHMPTKVADWYSGTVDEVEFLKRFSLDAYRQVVVEPLDTSSTPLPDEEDNTYEPVSIALRRVTEYFSTGMRTSLKEIIEVAPPGTEAGADTLLVRGQVVQMEPGSRAARYWVGFGAGATKVAVAGDILDSSTRETLVRFTHARKSGVGVYGGDYGDFLQDDATDVGADIGLLIAAFSKP